MSQDDYQKYLRKFIIWISGIVAAAMITLIVGFTTFVGSAVFEQGKAIETLNTKSNVMEQKVATLEVGLNDKVNKSDVDLINKRVVVTLDSIQQMQKYIFLNIAKK